MVEIVTPSLYFLTGICAYASFSHLFAGLHRPFNPTQLLFGLMSLAVSLLALFDCLSLRAKDLEGFIVALKWSLDFAILFFAIFLWFIALFSKKYSMRFLIGLSVLDGLMLLVNILQPYSMQYDSVDSLKTLIMPWGERVTFVVGHISSWFLLDLALVLVSFIYVFHALNHFYRQNGSRYVISMMAAIGFLMICTIEGILVRLSIIDFVYLGPYGFLGTIIVMNLIINHEHSQRLSQNDEKFRTLFEMSPLGMARNTMEGRYIEVNHALLDLTGYSLEGLRRLKYWDLTPREYEAQEEEQLKSLKNLGRYGPYEKEYFHRDGYRIPICLNGFLITGSDGKPYIWSFVEDITQRKQHEEHLHLMAKVFSNLAEAIIICDANNRIIATNPAFTTLTGYEQHEALGRNPSFLSGDRTPKSVYEDMWSSISCNDFWQGELLDKRKSGGLYSKWLSISVVRDDSGNVSHYIGNFTDISDRKRVENELRELNEQLEARVVERTRELSLAQEQAEMANRAKSDFLANMSHEIRTPMNSVLGMTLLALKTKLDPQQRGYLEKIRLSGDHLLSIINDILDFSKIEAGKLNLETVDFDLLQVIEMVNSLVDMVARTKDLKIEFEIDPSLPLFLRGDPMRLGQVLINFTTNAVKFTEKGVIHLRTKLLEETGNDYLLRFEVQDTGIGMTQETQDSLFQSFQQADASITRKYGGTGLGLAISKQLIEMMGGNIGASSRLGQGSLFWCEVRLSKGDSSCGMRQTLLLEDLESLRGSRILLVEDHIFNQQLANEFLEDVGATVQIANNGQEALDLLGKETFDYVLMDVQMPVMGGLEATRRIRADLSLTRIPVIAMTANVLNGDKQDCLDAGMNDFIAKPVQPDRLYSTLLRWLTKKADIEISSTSAEIESVPEDGKCSDDKTILNLNGLSNALLHDPVKIRKFAFLFLHSAQEGLVEMESALENHDIQTLVSLAHRIKSSAKATGAMSFANLCQQLEKCKHKEDFQLAQDIVVRLRRLLEEMKHEMETKLK